MRNRYRGLTERNRTWEVGKLESKMAANKYKCDFDVLLCISCQATLLMGFRKILTDNYLYLNK